MAVSDSCHWQREFWQILQAVGTQSITGFSRALRYHFFVSFCFVFLYKGRIQGKVYHVSSYRGLRALKQYK